MLHFRVFCYQCIYAKPVLAVFGSSRSITRCVKRISREQCFSTSAFGTSNRPLVNLISSSPLSSAVSFVHVKKYFSSDATKPPNITNDNPDAGRKSMDTTEKLVFDDCDNALSFEQFQHLARTDEEKEILSFILKECEYFRYTDERVPTHFTDEEMLELMSKPSKYQRLKYLRFLRKTELIKHSRKLKKEAKRAQRDAEREAGKTEEDPHTYKLWQNNMFIRISDAYKNRFYSWKLSNAVLYGPKIVFDLGFDKVMQKYECINAAYQLSEVHHANKIDREPFYIHLCNAGESNLVLKSFYKSFPNKYGFIHVTEKSYLDLFPKEKLVYLTPHAQECLDVYDPDMIYIIAAFVDKTVAKPLTLAKAKEEGIRTAKFPLDDYVLWKQGNKTLTINQVFQILLEWRNTGDWTKAFRFIPSRKIHKIVDKKSNTLLMDTLNADVKRTPNPKRTQPRNIGVNVGELFRKNK